MSQVTHGPTLHKATKDIENFRRKALEQGIVLDDLHSGNVIIDHTGQARLIDHIPMRAGDPNPKFQGTPKIDPRQSFLNSIQNMKAHGMEEKVRGPRVRSAPLQRGSAAPVIKQRSGSLMF